MKWHDVFKYLFYILAAAMAVQLLFIKGMATSLAGLALLLIIGAVYIISGISRNEFSSFITALLVASGIVIWFIASGIT
ncbi:MAG TPA: hypothetical protein VIG80_05605 [Bacillaceae bacterium]